MICAIVPSVTGIISYLIRVGYVMYHKCMLMHIDDPTPSVIFLPQYDLCYRTISIRYYLLSYQNGLGYVSQMHVNAH